MTKTEFNAAGIVSFWFEELEREDWFSGGAELDALIQGRFLGACRAALASNPQDHLSDARSALGAVLALDQFTRNIFRGTAEAFSGDQSALAITHGALARGFAEQLSADERQFLLMPLMHSEVLADQELSVKLFGDLGNENALKYAVEHRDIIARFGRFPHRNRALGRTSTPDELAFLEGHDGYGQ